MNVAAHVALHAIAVEKRLINRLREQGALSPNRAIPLAPDSRMEDRRLRGLLRAGAVVRLDSGRYYLDEAALAARNDLFSRTAMQALGVVVLITVTLLLWAIVLRVAA